MAELEKSEKRGGPELDRCQIFYPIGCGPFLWRLASLLFVPLSMDPSVGRAGMDVNARVVITTVVRFLSRLSSFKAT